ncbi:hypothetical protein [Segetibacter aerophilus]|uniref:Uncharacterized protein n=1 Tax=Segetibacter aerophilus TaxID=670293 RepID=A0A512BJ59_9BACT|nr:hypothetical protein [Segetibacter aerophilus]GEO12000.1 hypothetical protein SAE01_44960 [Segetibacter aerophilus]
MDLSTFNASLSGNTPPASSVYLQALWFDAKDNWKSAHDLVDHLNDKNACWVHAYLHRKEGDIRNADYWYKRAGKKRPSATLNEEWEQLVQTFLLDSNK